MIYRIETIEGEGPYMGKGDVNNALYDIIDHYDGEHPAPPSDGMHKMEVGDHCGFVSLEAMRRWFHKAIGLLDAYGFMVSVYKCKPIDVGQSGQCCFDRGTPVKRVPIKCFKTFFRQGLTAVN